MDQKSEGPKLTLIGNLILLLFCAGLIAGGYYLVAGKLGFSGSSSATSNPSDKPAEPGKSSPMFAPTPDLPPGETVTVGIAYGTEKERWLKWAVEQFAASPAGRGIKINLIPKGSLEGAQAVLKGDDESKKINVWSPASALYTDIFTQEWQLKYNSNPIAKSESLALSPMVFVFWDERLTALQSKYPEISFKTIGQAIAEPGGWDTIAKKSEWGIFKFGHTHPQQSNSGLMALVLLAYDYHNKNRDLAMKDILNADFQTWMVGLERGVSGMSNSTGNMMKSMVLRGPSTYDCLFVYENVVIDYLQNAEGRWGKLRVVYPRYNMWNDNPYYILDAPWSTKQQKDAAGKFLEFLMSDDVQKQALVHGLRPGNPAVPVLTPDSPFTKYADSGLKADLTGTLCDPPKADVINNLLQGWQRAVGSR